MVRFGEVLEESWSYGADMPAKPFVVESAVQAVLTDLDRSSYIDGLYAGQDKKTR